MKTKTRSIAALDIYDHAGNLISKNEIIMWFQAIEPQVGDVLRLYYKISGQSRVTKIKITNREPYCLPPPHDETISGIADHLCVWCSPGYSLDCRPATKKGNDAGIHACIKYHRLIQGQMSQQNKKS